ncbi:hypothetical protein RIF29_27212 [Crotalaria pallida]|uniref:Uncharacterized protein n=1 Tax=Crotalaria pallida TaxID=3830 RepID=A0AAN9EVW6_CROPI
MRRLTFRVFKSIEVPFLNPTLQFNFRPPHPFPFIPHTTLYHNPPLSSFLSPFSIFSFFLSSFNVDPNTKGKERKKKRKRRKRKQESQPSPYYN